jgi:hypothetical protein
MISKAFLNRSIFFKLLGIFSFNFICLNCPAQTYSLNDFVKVPIPVAEGKDWLQYNQMTNLIPFSVSFVNKRLTIKKAEQSSIDSLSLPMGRLIAIDDGEFGGCLLYKPLDTTVNAIYANDVQVLAGRDAEYYSRFVNNKNVLPYKKNKYFKIQDGNVKKFFIYRDSLYFIEGIDHMGFDSGSICRIDYLNNAFKVTKMLDFDDSPHAVYILKDTIIIATFRKFYIVDNWHKELVFDKLFWYGFNPNSVTADDKDNIYVGMFGFYAKIIAKTHGMELYRYNK